MTMSGQVCIVAYNSPQKIDRDYARKIHKESGLKFIECHIATSLELCEQRDTKGVYAKARSGVIKNFAGISAPYEKPDRPELKIDTAHNTLEACLTDVVTYLEKSGIIKDETKRRISQSLVKPMRIEEKAGFDKLAVVDINIEQL